MEIQEDKGWECSENSERNLAKRKAPSETPEQDKEKDKQTDRMETDHESSKEDLSQEEEVLENLLHEWKNLDERFIPEEQKNLYTETFQQYKSKLEKGKASSVENQETQKESRYEQNGSNKGGENRKKKHKGLHTTHGRNVSQYGKSSPAFTVFQTLSQVNQWFWHHGISEA